MCFLFKKNSSCIIILINILTVPLFLYTGGKNRNVFGVQMWWNLKVKQLAMVYIKLSTVSLFERTIGKLISHCRRTVILTRNQHVYNKDRKLGTKENRDCEISFIGKQRSAKPWRVSKSLWLYFPQSMASVWERFLPLCIIFTFCLNLSTTKLLNIFLTH